MRWPVHRCIRRILPAAALCLALAAPVRAQITTSAIQGSVKDDSGAVLTVRRGIATGDRPKERVDTLPARVPSDGRALAKGLTIADS